MSDLPILGSIELVGFSFAPAGWAFCNGQVLSIAQNDALFALLGTTYGGDGQSTFNLPDLRGRAAIHQGQGPGLSSYALGQVGGAESVSLVTNQMPQHSHQIKGSGRQGTDVSPANAYVAAGDALRFAGSADTQMGPTGVAGGSQPHENRPPSLALNFIIALEGIFPARN